MAFDAFCPSSFYRSRRADGAGARHHLCNPAYPQCRAFVTGADGPVGSAPVSTPASPRSPPLRVPTVADGSSQVAKRTVDLPPALTSARSPFQRAVGILAWRGRSETARHVALERRAEARRSGRRGVRRGGEQVSIARRVRARGTTGRAAASPASDYRGRKRRGIVARPTCRNWRRDHLVPRRWIGGPTGSDDHASRSTPDASSRSHAALSLAHHSQRIAACPARSPGRESELSDCVLIASRSRLRRGYYRFRRAAPHCRDQPFRPCAPVARARTKVDRPRATPPAIGRAGGLAITLVRPAIPSAVSAARAVAGVIATR